MRAATFTCTRCGREQPSYERDGLFDWCRACHLRPLRALTLWQPYADDVMRGLKLVENRPTPPPRKQLYQPLAIHAGVRYEVRWPYPDGMTPRSEAACTKSCVLAVAWLGGYLDLRDDARVRVLAPGGDSSLLSRLDQNEWWVGPVGIHLLRVLALPTPVPCAGRQGYWTLPAEVDRAVREQLAGIM